MQYCTADYLWKMYVLLVKWSLDQTYKKKTNDSMKHGWTIINSPCILKWFINKLMNINGYYTCFLCAKVCNSFEQSEWWTVSLAF